MYTRCQPVKIKELPIQYFINYVQNIKILKITYSKYGNLLTSMFLKWVHVNLKPATKNVKY